MLRNFYLLLFVPALPAVTVYDLNSGWSDANNPNSVWAYRQGSNALPHNDVSVCCPAGYGITAAWAPSGQVGNFLPLWAKATANNPGAGFMAGDIIVHSVDGFNGNPALGESNVTWTAPAAGTISISGGVWYAHGGYNRSNDFLLLLRSTTLASGTVSAVNGATRSSPVTFSASGLTVNAGDAVELLFRRSVAQAAGSFAGVNLTITETPIDSVPEPGTGAVVVLAGLAFCSSARARTRATIRKE